MRLALALLSTLAGCTGEVAPSGVPSPSPVPSCEEGGVGSAPLRRLTHDEYDRTVRDLLGDSSLPAARFPNDASPTGFDNEAARLGVGPQLAEAYFTAAEAIAGRAVAERLATIVPCDPASGEAACGARFVAELGRRAYRRPLTDDELLRLGELFESVRASLGFVKAVEIAVTAMLQSRHFLYRVELAPGPGPVVRLSDWEMATRLSYFLWGTMPDDALFAAAAAGRLRDEREIAAEVDRMLTDPKARVGVASFHAQWLRLGALETLNRDPVLYPELDDGLRASLRDGTLRFVEDVVFDGGGLDAMLLSETTFADDRLAPIYGVAPTGGWQPVALDPSRRAGLLTEASILALGGKPREASVVLRGRFVRERLLCHDLPEPPAGVDTTLPAAMPGQSTRERLARHSTDASCAVCHELMDPIGFGLGHYDALGRWRDTDEGGPIDSSGTVVGLAGADRSFDGARELAGVLAESEDVRRCYVEKWFTFAHGRSPETVDSCALAEIEDAFDAGARSPLELLRAIATSESFRMRPALSGGG
jgi:hypothetical protein